MSFIPSAQPGSVFRCAKPFSCVHQWRWLALPLIALALGAQAATVTWDADTGTPGAQDGAGSWSTSSPNWWNGSGDAVWNNGDSAIFGSATGSAGTVSVISSGITVGGLTFNTHAGYLLNTTTASTLTLVGNPTITANVDATLNLVVAGSGFTKEGAGVLTLNPGANNNTFGGTTIINNGRVVLGGGTDNVIQLSSPNVVVNAGAALVYTAANPLPTSATLTLDGGALTNANATGGKLLTLNRLVMDNNSVLVGSFSQASMLVTNYDIRSGLMGLPRLQNIAINNFPLVKSTTGTATIDTASQSAGSQGFVVTIQGGTLVMEYLNPGPSGDTAVRAKYGVGALTLAGGSLRHYYPAGSGGRTETGITGTTVRPGGTSLVISNANTSGGYTLAMAALTRNVGGTLDFSKVTAGGAANFTTTTPNVNGILGGYATFAGADWALGTTIASAAANYLTSTDPATWTATTNVNLTANPIASLDDKTVYSLRLANGASVTVNPAKTLTIASGGLLVAGNAASTITGGALKGPAGADLIVHQYSSADCTIASDLADNGSSSLTKAGGGKLILTGNNTFTGTNFLNGGVLEVGDLAKLASGGTYMNGGTLRYTGGSASSGTPLTIGGNGGGFDVSVADTTLTVSQGIGEPTGANAQLTKSGPGTLALNGANTYAGVTVINQGTVSAATALAGKATVFGGTFTGAGAVGAVVVKNSGTLSPGAAAGTMATGPLTLEQGTTNIFDITNFPGTSDLITVSGNLKVTNSTIVLRVAGADLQPGIYTLFTYTGTKAGSFNPTVVIGTGNVNGSLSINESGAGQVTLVVSSNVVITAQPADTVASTNAPASFSVAAAGSAPLSYQWYSFGADPGNSPAVINDATNSTFTISNAQPSDSGYYEAVVSNPYSSATSRVASLFVGDIAPVIGGVSNKTVIAGNNVTFTASVFGNPPPSLQWLTNGTPVAGATSLSLTLNNVPYALDGAQVALVASNSAGNSTNTATLTVIVTPSITLQPTNLVVNAGSAASFVAAASGVPAPALQWYKNGAPISGATDASYSIPSAAGSDIGAYTMVASNAAGSATSSAATLTVSSTSLALASMTPSNNATGICIDTPLYVTFNGNISTVNAGRVRIYSATNSVTPVDVIDVSTNQVVTNGTVGVYNVQSRTIGGSAYRTFPVLLLSSNSAAIFPHNGSLAYGQSYYLVIDAGVFQDSSGAYYSGLTNTSAWQFTTKAAGPANGTNIVVAADGGGDFNTVQGAVDFIPAANSNHVQVNIQNGLYQEIVFLNTKNNVTFRGQSRHGTVISYVNNDALNTGTSARPMFRIRGNDVALVNLTLTNATPKGGTQAEALRVGDGSKRFLAFYADFDSYQDTILVNSSGDSAYFQDCHIQGDTDFIWGLGTIFITNCEVMCMSSQSHVTQARTDAITNGIAFVNCQITRASTAVTNCDLGRDAGNGFPFSQVVYVNCGMDSQIRPEGWIDGGLTVKSSLRFWEYGSTDLNSNPLDVSSRASWSQQIPFSTATDVADVVFWLYGWKPQVPQLVSQPQIQSISVVSGQPVLQIGGDTGAAYEVQASTNLINWNPVFTTNSAAVPFLWADPAGTSYGTRFYRALSGPPLP
jgi:autotransporter-associated beta strand protein